VGAVRREEVPVGAAWSGKASRGRFWNEKVGNVVLWEVDNRRQRGSVRHVAHVKGKLVDVVNFKVSVFFMRVELNKRAFFVFRFVNQVHKLVVQGFWTPDYALLIQEFFFSTGRSVYHTFTQEKLELLWTVWAVQLFFDLVCCLT